MHALTGAHPTACSGLAGPSPVAQSILGAAFESGESAYLYCCGHLSSKHYYKAGILTPKLNSYYNLSQRWGNGIQCCAPAPPLGRSAWLTPTPCSLHAKP